LPKRQIEKYTSRDVKNEILTWQHCKGQLTTVKNSHVTLKM